VHSNSRCLLNAFPSDSIARTDGRGVCWRRRLILPNITDGATDLASTLYPTPVNIDAMGDGRTPAAHRSRCLTQANAVEHHHCGLRTRCPSGFRRHLRGNRFTHLPLPPTYLPYLRLAAYFFPFLNINYNLHARWRRTRRRNQHLWAVE